MKTLITGWRKAWAQGEFPFLFVQVALCKYTDDVEVAPRLVSARTTGKSNRSYSGRKDSGFGVQEDEMETYRRFEELIGYQALPRTENRK